MRKFKEQYVATVHPEMSRAVQIAQTVYYVEILIYGWGELLVPWSSTVPMQWLCASPGRPTPQFDNHWVSLR